MKFKDLLRKYQAGEVNDDENAIEAELENIGSGSIFAEQWSPARPAAADPQEEEAVKSSKA